MIHLENKLTGRFLVWASRHQDLHSTISVVENVDLTSRIVVKPRNTLHGKFEVAERPTEFITLRPIQDSTIRSLIPTLNYGSNSAMLVGINDSDGEQFKSILQFDLDKLPQKRELKEAILKLTNNYSRSNLSLSIFTVNRDWLEDDITWQNQPATGFKIADIELQSDQSDIQIDLTPLIIKWYNEELPNYGLYLVITDNTPVDIVQFGTRESSTPPLLEVQLYKDVASAGMSKLSSSITVIAHRESSLTSKIEVMSRNRRADLSSQLIIEAKNNSTSIPSMMTVRLSRYSESRGSIIIPVKNGKSSISAQIKVGQHSNLRSNMVIEKKYGQQELFSQLTVRASRYTDLSSRLSIEKKHMSQSLSSTITVRQKESSQLRSVLEIKRKSSNNTLSGLIKIPQTNSLPSQLSILRKLGESSLRSLITIRANEDLGTSITVPWRKSLGAKLELRHKRDLACVIRVNSNLLNARLIIKEKAAQSLKSSITVRVHRISDLRSNLTVVTDYDDDDGYTYIM